MCGLLEADFLRPIIAPVQEQGGVTLSYVWVSTEHCDSSKKGEHGVVSGACGEQYNWKAPNTVLVFQDRVGLSSEAKVFRAHGHTRHLRVRARTSWLLSSCGRLGRRVETALRVCRSRVG